MLLGLSYFLFNREVSDLGLHHIPKTLQRGNFSACPEGNRKNYRKLQTIQLPQASWTFTRATMHQPVRNVGGSWMLGRCYKAHHQALQWCLMSLRGVKSWECSTISVTSLSTAQPEAPCTPAPKAFWRHSACTWSLFALRSVPTIKFYLVRKKPKQ